MRIRVPYLIQDPWINADKGLEKPIERCTFEGEVFCLDGPVTRRVAILDFHPETGELCPGVRFRAPVDENHHGTYELAEKGNFEAPDFILVNVFTTVLSTLYMYEEKDALGREVEWAFGAPQLLVVPRAGEWANAFYQRESHSLQFFHFPATPTESGPKTVYTGLSQDIVAHETAHAILDGVAPDLYHCLSPQSLAIHEAVADLTALLLALRSRKLREHLLAKSGGSVSGENAFTRLAEQFGSARDVTGRARQLRSLWNERNLNADDDSLDELNRLNQATRAEPHLLSEVLSGALYRVFAHLHELYRAEQAGKKQSTEYSASGFALFVAGSHFKRLVLRSLDYLPPGEVSFADYGRAILASDQASFPEWPKGRDALVAEFVRRGIVADAAELAVETDFEHPAVRDLDLETLVASDWAAYDFANRNRELLGIPANVHFRVRPRLRAKKEYRTAGGAKLVEECIFKVSWDRTEDNPRNLPLPSLRQITVGTTLAVDWKTRRVRVLLRSQASAPAGAAPAELRAAEEQRRDRDAMLRRLVAGHRLSFGPEADDEPQFGAAARVEVSGDLMRIRGSGRMLHLADGGEEHAHG
jgi:hypothetical protein